MHERTISSQNAMHDQMRFAWFLLFSHLSLCFLHFVLVEFQKWNKNPGNYAAAPHISYCRTKYLSCVNCFPNFKLAKQKEVFSRVLITLYPAHIWVIRCLIWNWMISFVRNLGNCRRSIETNRLQNDHIINRFQLKTSSIIESRGAAGPKWAWK